MINEARKRDHLANAVLALSFAANAAQSKEHLVQSGKIESTGMAAMSRTMETRRKANKNLDSPRVSEPARNRKKKTFEEFVAEAYLIEKTFPSKEEAKKYHEKNPPFGGEPYILKQKGRSGGPKEWRPIRADKRKAQEERRTGTIDKTKLTYDELLTKSKGDKERAAAALDAEETGIKKTVERGRRIQKATGVKQSLGHKQPVQPDDPKPEDPGHTRSNTQIEPLSSNTAKQNRRPQPGESGYGLTRAQSITDAQRRGDKLLNKVDDLIKSVQSGKSSRPARLLSYLRRPKPKISPEKSAELRARMSAAAKSRGLD
jgi:hypothetical protein